MSTFVNAEYMQILHCDIYVKVTIRCFPKSALVDGLRLSKSKQFLFHSHSVCQQQNRYYRTHTVWLKVFAFLKNSTIEVLYLLTWHHAGWGQFLSPFSLWKTTRYHSPWVYLENTCLHSLSRLLKHVYPVMSWPTSPPGYPQLKQNHVFSLISALSKWVCGRYCIVSRENTIE